MYFHSKRSVLSFEIFTIYCLPVEVCYESIINCHGMLECTNESNNIMGITEPIRVTTPTPGRDC